MTAKRSQPQRIGFLLSLAAALCFLMLYGLAASDAQEKSEIGLAVPQFCGDREIEDGFFHANIYIDNEHTTTSRSYSAGKHEVRVEAVPASGEEGKWIVKEIKLLKGGAGEPTQRFTPNTAVATVSLDFPATSGNDWYMLRIAIDRCGTTAQKEVALAAVSEDCKDFDWEGSSIQFDGRFRLNKDGLAHGKTVLDPGTYKVRFHHPYLAPDSGDITTIHPNYTGLAKISRVEVYRPSPKRELVGTYPADEEGLATVTLDAGLWKENSVPDIKVYVEKLCDLRFATVEFFVGQVEIKAHFDEFKTEFEPAQPGMNLFKRDTIKIGPGSSIQLKSQGGIYLIKISVPQSGATAQLNIGIVITAEGRKFIEASTESTTKIEIKRMVIYKPPQPPPPPNVPPEYEPEPGSVIFKTPTLKVTDKQTNYMVSYDDKTGVTTVGVEEGEVEVTPTNSSLQPFTLAAKQQVQVTDSSVGAITSYSGSGGNTGRILLYVGISIVGLLALLGLFYFFRRHQRLAMPPALHPAGVNPAGWNAPPANVAPSVANNEASPKCPNPQCGKAALVGQEVCAFCGTRLMQK